MRRRQRGNPDWQRLSNVLGASLGTISLGLAMSQLLERPWIAPVGLGAGMLIAAAFWEKGRGSSRSSNPPRRCAPADIDACVLGRSQWDRSTDVCGDDPPDPSTAATRLARKRWDPPQQRRVQAKRLR